MSEYQFNPAEYIDFRILEDGRLVAIRPMLFGEAQIVIGPADSPQYDDVWHYATIREACVAWQAWNPFQEAEPSGWVKHPASGRRRPDGDPEQEYVKER